MAEITLDWIGAKLSEVLDEMRGMRAELSAMRSEVRRRITSLEKAHRS